MTIENEIQTIQRLIDYTQNKENAVYPTQKQIKKAWDKRINKETRNALSLYFI